MKAQNAFSTDTLNKEEKFIITAGAGYSFRFSKLAEGLSNEEKRYQRKLKSGFTYDLGAYYRLNEQCGAGLKYNVFNAGGDISNTEYEAPNGDTGTGFVSQDIKISYYGVSFITDDIEADSRHIINLELGAGYMHYTNNAYINGNYTYTAGNIAIHGNMGYKYTFFRNLSVGPQLAFLGTSYRKLNVEGDNGYEGEIKYRGNRSENNLWRIDFRIAALIRF